MKARSGSSVLATSVFVTLATVVVSLISFANQLLIARLFGVSKELTAFGIAIGGPMIVSGVLSISIAYSMVPFLVRARLEDHEADRFVGALLLRLVGAAAIVTLVGLALSNPLVDFLGHSLDGPTLRTARAVGHVSWVTLALTVALAQLGAIHDAAQRFLLPVVANGGPYVGMIAAGFFFGRHLGVLAIAVGMFAGSLLSVVVLTVTALPDLSFSPPSGDQRARIARYFRRLPAVAVSMLIFSAFAFIDAYWAPQIGPTSLPTLGFGQRLLIAFGALVVSGPFAIIVPRLAKAATEERHEDFRSDAGRALRTVLSFGGFVAVAASVLAAPLVKLLFERGKFDPEATVRVAGVLPWMMAGMVPMLSVALLYRAFYALDWVRPTVLLSLGTVGGYFVLSGLLSHSYGTSGIAAAYSAVWAGCLAFALKILWRDHTRELFSAENRRFGGSLIVSLAGTLVAVWVSARLLLIDYAGLSHLAIAARLTVCGTVGLTLFNLLSVKVLHMEDTKLIFDYFGGLFRRMARLKVREAG